MNWIERRAKQEANLKNAADVWAKASAAIEESCASYKRHYPDGAKVKVTTLNGHRVQVTATSMVDTPTHTTEEVRRISITFDESEPMITVTIDHGKPKIFRIEANPGHCYIVWGGREISADEFAELVLKDVLFGELKK